MPDDDQAWSLLHKIGYFGLETSYVNFAVIKHAFDPTSIWWSMATETVPRPCLLLSWFQCLLRVGSGKRNWSETSMLTASWPFMMRPEDLMCTLQIWVGWLLLAEECCIPPTKSKEHHTIEIYHGVYKNRNPSLILQETEDRPSRWAQDIWCTTRSTWESSLAEEYTARRSVYPGFSVPQLETVTRRRRGLGFYLAFNRVLDRSKKQ